MVKMSVRSDRVCKRPWNFERVPNKMIEGHDKALIFTSTKEACLAACLNEVSRAQAPISPSSPATPLQTPIPTITLLTLNMTSGIQLGQPSLIPPGLVLEAGGTST